MRTSESTEDRLVHGTLLACGILISLGLLSNGLETALHFNGFPADGPLQLFNALRRIDAGQRIGVNFQFFHGPGVPFLFYPGYRLAGATLFASEVSRQVVSILLFLAVMAGVGRAWTGAWRAGLSFAVVATAVMIALHFSGLMAPENSTMGVRSTMPLIVGIHLLLRRPGRRADVERGALVGLALLLGTEHGAASLAALGVVHSIVALRSHRWRESAVSFLFSAATAVAVYVGVIALLAGPAHVDSVLRFTFRDLPADQMWYFGAPPNAFLSRWSQILPSPKVMPLWLLLGAAVAIAVAGLWRGARDADHRRTFAEAFLAVYAVISLASMLGAFGDAYAVPAFRVAIIIIMATVFRSWIRWRPSLAVGRPFLARHLPALFVGAMVIGGALAVPHRVMTMVQAPIHVAGAHLLGSDGPTMSEGWQRTEATGMAVINAARVRLGRPPMIWSTYAGLLEWKAGVFNPYSDYIIHALGPGHRGEYVDKFATTKPDVVQTILPSFTPYEEWLEGANWDFYRALLADYDVAATGPWSIFWTPRTGPSPAAPYPPVKSEFRPGDLSIRIDPLASDSVGLLEVRLYYHAKSRMARLPIIGSLPRYLVDIEGAAARLPISLAPYDSVRAFPVVTRRGSPVQLRGHVESLLGGGTLAIDSVRVERIPVSPANMTWMTDLLRGAH